MRDLPRGNVLLNLLQKEILFSLMLGSSREPSPELGSLDHPSSTNATINMSFPTLFEESMSLPYALSCELLYCAFIRLFVSYLNQIASEAPAQRGTVP
jgi:hypothetical protein